MKTGMSLEADPTSLNSGLSLQIGAARFYGAEPENHGDLRPPKALAALPFKSLARYLLLGHDLLRKRIPPIAIAMMIAALSQPAAEAIQNCGLDLKPTFAAGFAA